MELNNLADLLFEQLRELYSAETQLDKALPKLIKKATSTTLSQILRDQRIQRKKHLERLREIGASLGAGLEGRRCKAASGMVNDATGILKGQGDDRVIDAALIGAAQRACHFQISAYGTARTLAGQLGHTAVATTLRQSEEEESALDEKLTLLAIDEIYPALKMSEIQAGLSPSPPESEKQAGGPVDQELLVSER
jgi:ferritin-like metal-binding protein YciE